MKNWIVLVGLLGTGCGGAVGSTPNEPAPNPPVVEITDTTAEAGEDVQDVQTDAAPALDPCSVACTDVTAPCGCRQGVCTFRNYDGGVTRTCLERH